MRRRPSRCRWPRDGLMAGCGIPVSDVPRKILHVLGDRLGEPGRPDSRRGAVQRARILQRLLADQTAELVRRRRQHPRRQPDSVHEARVASPPDALGTRHVPSPRRPARSPTRSSTSCAGWRARWVRRATPRSCTAGCSHLLDEEPPGLVVGPVRARVEASYDVREAGRRTARSARRWTRRATSRSGRRWTGWSRTRPGPPVPRSRPTTCCRPACSRSGRRCVAGSRRSTRPRTPTGRCTTRASRPSGCATSSRRWCPPGGRTPDGWRRPRRQVGSLLGERQDAVVTRADLAGPRRGGQCRR